MRKLWERGGGGRVRKGVWRGEDGTTGGHGVGGEIMLHILLLL